MANSNEPFAEQEKNSNVSDKSILDQILDDFIDFLSQDPDFTSEIAQSLREIIHKGKYSDKEKIIKLLKK
jgi:hypothetical protein